MVGDDDHAAGRLVLLIRDQRELETRMGELDHAHDHSLSRFIPGIGEDWMLVMRRLESSIAAA